MAVNEVTTRSVGTESGRVIGPTQISFVLWMSVDWSQLWQSVCKLTFVTILAGSILLVRTTQFRLVTAGVDLGSGSWQKKITSQLKNKGVLSMWQIKTSVFHSQGLKLIAFTFRKEVIWNWLPCLITIVSIRPGEQTGEERPEDEPVEQVLLADDPKFLLPTANEKALGDFFAKFSSIRSSRGDLLSSGEERLKGKNELAKRS